MIEDEPTGKASKQTWRFDTAEKRRDLFEKYKAHRLQGYTKDSFPECNFETLRDIVNKNPQEFPQEELEEVERKYAMFWEGIGIDGSKGAEAFNAPGWIFNMKNRFKWKDRSEILGDSDNPFEVKISMIE